MSMMMFSQLERIRKYRWSVPTPAPQAEWAFTAVPKVFISVRSEMVDYVRALLDYMDQPTSLITVSAYEPNVGAVRAHMDDLYHQGATLIFADHAGYDYDDAAQFMVDTPTWPVKVFNTGHIIADESNIDPRIVHSAANNEDLCTYLSSIILDPVALDHQLGNSDFDLTALMQNRTKSTTFDRVIVIHYGGREAEDLTTKLYSQLAARGVSVGSVHIADEMVVAAPNFLDGLLRENPVGSDQFQSEDRTRTLFICYYTSQQEYNRTLVLFGSVSAYDNNYWVFVDTGTVTYPTMGPAIVCSFVHALLVVRNLATTGLKFYNLYVQDTDNSLPFRSSAVALSDLVADLVPSFAKDNGQTMSIETLINKKMVLIQNDNRKYFRYNLMLSGHLSTKTIPEPEPTVGGTGTGTNGGSGGQPLATFANNSIAPKIYPMHAFAMSYNLASSGSIINPASASINAGAVDRTNGKSVGYWCLPLAMHNSAGNPMWIRLRCTNCTLTLSNTAIPVPLAMSYLLMHTLQFITINGQHPVPIINGNAFVQNNPDKIPDAILALDPLPVIECTVYNLSIVTSLFQTSYPQLGQWTSSFYDPVLNFVSTLGTFN